MGSFKISRSIILLLVGSFICACIQNKPARQIISGEAQGTTFTIVYLGEPMPHLTGKIDSLFEAVDKSLSTYRRNSKISAFNQSDAGILADTLLLEMFKLSMLVNKYTNGYFDPTIGKIVKFWGFHPDSLSAVYTFDSIIDCRGINRIKIKSDSLIKSFPCLELDFNAIAQGYTVDLISSFLEQQGVQNFIVELGGEVRAKGMKDDENFWTVGIEKPENTGKRELMYVISLENKSLATSGNYRKYKWKDGRKLGHTIDPFTGQPKLDSLLSVSVIAQSCAVADGVATACMAMGLDKAYQWASRQDSLGFIFIYSDSNNRNQTKVLGNLNLVKVE